MWNAQCRIKNGGTGTRPSLPSPRGKVAPKATDEGHTWVANLSPVLRNRQKPAPAPPFLILHSAFRIVPQNVTLIHHPSDGPPCLACGLGHATALTPHRGVIHYRGAASLPEGKARKDGFSAPPLLILHSAFCILHFHYLPRISAPASVHTVKKKGGRHDRHLRPNPDHL